MSGDAPGSGDGQATAARASSDVFISYASQDKAVADAVCEALERAGVACWIAPRDVTPGEFYADAIVRALNEARILVLVLTENAVTSPHVLREVERTSSKRHAIVTLRLTDVSLPPALEYFLSASHWLDATASGADSAMPKLVEAVKRLVTPATGAATVKLTADVFPLPPGTKQSQRLRRVIIALTAVIAVVVAYLAADKLWLTKQAATDRSAEVTPQVPAPPAPAISEKSVAVLPFVDMSEKKDQEYFSDGMAEEIIDLLVKVPDLRVPARTSSFYFKGKSEDIPTIAKRLMVAHVLEGSVRKSGKHLRITAQLIRADNGYHLWSETYDREMNDVFRVQDDIANAVVAALKVSLLEARSSRPPLTGNMAAYTLYLQARSAWANGVQQADDWRAIEYLRRAAQLDPAFARAWALRAIFAVGDATYFGTKLDAPSLAEARAAAAQALKLDPKLSDAHFAAGRILYEIDWDWKAAEAELRQAVDLDPANALALATAADIAATQGNDDEAQRLIERAIALDPLYAWYHLGLGWVQIRTGRLTEAEASFRKALELNPTGAALHEELTMLFLIRGDPAAALAEIGRETDEVFRQRAMPLVLDAAGRRSEADIELALLKDKYAGTAAVAIAEVYANRREADQAFAWLERAYLQRDGDLLNVKTDPLLKNLRGDRRYKAFLHRMRLAE